MTNATTRGSASINFQHRKLKVCERQKYETIIHMEESQHVVKSEFLRKALIKPNFPSCFEYLSTSFPHFEAPIGGTRLHSVELLARGLPWKSTNNPSCPLRQNDPHCKLTVGPHCQGQHLHNSLEKLSWCLNGVLTPTFESRW